MSNQQGKSSLTDTTLHNKLGQQSDDNTVQSSSGVPKVKPRGRMSAFAYFVQSCKEEQMRVNPKQESTSFTQISKECAERWKIMNDQEKSSFHELAEKDKKRYDEEMANYKDSNYHKNTEETKGMDESKQLHASMRNCAGYFLFCKEQKPLLKMTMPHATLWEKAQEVDRRWNELPENQKRKYDPDTVELTADLEKIYWELRGSDPSAE